MFRMKTKNFPAIYGISILFLFLLVISGQGRKISNWFEGLSLGIREKVWVATRRGENKSVQQDQNCELAANELSVLNGRLQEENKILRGQLDVDRPDLGPLLLADIVGRAGGIMRLNKGGEQGVKLGKAVIVEKALIGLVSEVSERGSSVGLPNGNSFRMVVWVRGKVSGTRRATGLLLGKEGAVRLTKVVLSEQISEGDMVVSAGSAGEPADFMIGVISRVFEGDGVYKEANVEPAANYPSLKSVFVVK